MCNMYIKYIKTQPVCTLESNRRQLMLPLWYIITGTYTFSFVFMIMVDLYSLKVNAPLSLPHKGSKLKSL